ncbi:MAG: TauD/TfdA family dioxygenase [Ilumatobacteraceae bacterium]
MNEIHIEPTGATLGAVVSGVELRSLDDADWTLIEDAFHEHGVLVFPQQHLTAEEQTAFARRFGELSIETMTFTNCTEDGSLLPSDDPLMRHLAGNEGWHTDSSFQDLAAKASMLSARRVPAHGGQTEWADMRAAYDALDDAMCRRIEGLRAFHSLYYSQARLGVDPSVTAAANARLGGRRTTVDLPVVVEAPLRPLVKVHPVTGRRALFVGRHAYGIVGMDPDESRQLLDELNEWACQPPRVHRHTWQAGDLAVWDNRCVLHRARPYDPNEARFMVHTRVAGDPATEHAAMVAAPPITVAAASA